MILIIHNTDKIVTINGVPSRIWEGKTDKDISVHCFISNIAVRTDISPEELKQFDDELFKTFYLSEQVNKYKYVGK